MAREDTVLAEATQRALRKMRGDVSKSEIARRAHTTYLNVHRWESGQSTPTLNNLDSLASAYGTDLTGVVSAIEKAKRVIRAERSVNDEDK